MLSHFSDVQLSATLWTVAHQAPLVHGILQARILEWVAVSSFRGSSQPRDQTCVSYVSCHWQAGSLPLALPGKPPFRGEPHLFHRAPGGRAKTNRIYQRADFGHVSTKAF